MSKNFVHNFLICAGTVIVFLNACKDDSYLAIPASLPAQNYTESFDNFQEAYANGWRTNNRSAPFGRKWYDVAEAPNFGSVDYVAIYYPEWEQAQFTLDSAQFPNTPFPGRYWQKAYGSQRASNGYAATSIASASVIGIGAPLSKFNISNWLISPETLLQNGDKIIFYTYSKGLCRLQLWLNTSNTLNVGSGSFGNGDFNIKLLDIDSVYARVETNPSVAFPTEWTRFEAEVTGLKKAVKGRFAFRHFLEDQLPVKLSTINPNDIDTIYTQIHKSVIGIDEVTYKSEH
jgi:hypothetical protein